MSNNYNNPIKITKITDSVRGNIKNVEKKRRKEVFEDKAKNKFQNVTVKITPEDGDKLDEFIQYCQNQIMCYYCMKKCSGEYFISNDQDELVLTCPHCNNITIDGFQKGKDYVKWFNNILQDYGMTFKDGFPKLVTTFTNSEMITKSWNL